MTNLISLIYFFTAVLLIISLRKMSSPKTARQGIILAGWGMLIAVLATFFLPQIHNYVLIIIAAAIGGLLAWYSGKKVKMVNMPQMIALYNGMGGGAAAAIAAIELLQPLPLTLFTRILAIIGGMIGTVALSGSVIAFAKLQDLIKRSITMAFHQWLNILLVISSLVLAGAVILFPLNFLLLPCFFAALILLGISFTLPIGGANMPVVISLFNAMTGLAVGLNGFVLDNSALIIAGTVVGASGTLLTQLMAKAMNKSVFSILFAPMAKTQTTSSTDQEVILKPIEITDAAVMMAYANKVIITPGYGMAVAQAQHKVWELIQQLQGRGVAAKFAIHPVAGRMPGHMNVLLAEAGVPYDIIYDLEEINPEFSNTDVALVIGANDVVNPAARSQQDSPIYGMPILNAALAKNVLVIKRGQGRGFSGVENDLFGLDNTRMLYGDAQDVINKLIQAIKTL